MGLSFGKAAGAESEMATLVKDNAGFLGAKNTLLLIPLSPFQRIWRQISSSKATVMSSEQGFSFVKVNTGRKSSYLLDEKPEGQGYYNIKYK